MPDTGAPDAGPPDVGTDGGPGPCAEHTECGDGMRCVDDLCVACQAGEEEGCTCLDDACDAPLICLEGRCAECTPAIVGCPCVDDGCEDDLVCDEDEETCREALTCEEIECLPHQRCAPGEEGADAWCPEECNPPYDWRDGGCFAEVPPSCLEDDENSILELCTEQHRECVDLPGGADCGDCLPGFRSQDAVCVVVLTCADLPCADDQRDCTPAQEHADAECAGCQAGYREEGDACVPEERSTCEPGPFSIADQCEAAHRECVPAAEGATCGACLADFIELDQACVEHLRCEGDLAARCAQDNRECVAEPNGHCGDCLQGFIADGDACRAPVTCADLEPCPQGHHCADDGGDGEAACVDQACEDDEVLGADGQCIPCPLCREAAEDCATPLLYNGLCIWATRPGFYHVGGEAHACDADGDGWVRDAAREAITSNDPVLAANARCSLRSVDRFELRGQQSEVTVALAAPFDLYESDRNDSEEDLHNEALGSTGRFPYGGAAGRPLHANEVNALTKACVHVDGDFNGHDGPDVEEAAAPGSNSVARRFSYFVELYRGTFVADQPGLATGRYVIEEKSRAINAAAGLGVALRHDAPEADAPSHWRQCTVWRDADYDDTPSAAGLDLAEFEDGGAVVLTHHSQFRCVLALRNDHDLLQQAPRYARSLADLDPARAERELRMNLCVATGSHDPLEGEPNPHDPQLECQLALAAADLEDGFVGFAVVGFVDYGTDDRPPDGPNALGLYDSYQRGCINECVEIVSVQPDQEACPGFSAEVGLGLALACDGRVEDSGRLVCGCQLNYGGHGCSFGCPDASLLYSDDFDLATREGVWMCSQIAASEGLPLESQDGAIRLVGAVPAPPFDRSQPLESDGCGGGGGPCYRLR